MFQTLKRTAIEVKISRADWKNETRLKVQPWMDHAHRFIYAVPYGLEIPEGLDPLLDRAGIWWVKENGAIIVHRKAKTNKNPLPLPEKVIQRIAYKATK